MLIVTYGFPRSKLALIDPYHLLENFIKPCSTNLSASSNEPNLKANQQFLEGKKEVR